MILLKNLRFFTRHHRNGYNMYFFHFTDNTDEYQVNMFDMPFAFDSFVILKFYILYSACTSCNEIPVIRSLHIAHPSELV